jgi:biopolymer transport protein ExbD
MIVTVDSAGRVFFGLDGKEIRKQMLTQMGEKYSVKFDDKEITRFAIMSTFGMTVQQLKEYLPMGETERKDFMKQSRGVPYDSLNNQLGDWIRFGRLADASSSDPNRPKEKDLRFAIKGDGNADYTAIKRVIEIFQEMKVNRFNLVTDLEQDPNK